MTSSAAAVSLAHPLSPEDRSRAEFYALLARLFSDAPDAGLLRSVAGAAPIDSDSPVALAWNTLVAASGAMDAAAAEQEYTDLFIGVGQCAVNLHASHWIAGAMLQRPLAELRTELASLGLGRRENVVMLEDHLSALFETMRILVAGESDRAPAPLLVQRAFFERHIASWSFSCCTAIQKTALANYYGRVAELTEQFMALDRDALAME
ncbi:MAG: molecular chaperone TorD family protein [Betaproteobacteria bacterium]